MDQARAWKDQQFGVGSKARTLGRRFIREPLVHFALIGLLLDSRRIVIDDRVVGNIVQRYAAVWQRPPTPEEMRGLLDSYVQEEILYREGVAQGLLEDDPVIRRRVRQKMDVISEENGRNDPPTEAQLQAWLDAHADSYAVPPVLTFSQVLFDPVRLGRRTGAVVAAAKAKLAAGTDPNAFGDALLPPKLADVSADRVARDFGDDFAAAILKLPVGGWQGPVRSGYGLHLVRVTERKPGRKPALDEVKAAVQRDWENDRRLKSSAAYYDRLRRDYSVVIKADLPAAARPETR